MARYQIPNSLANEIKDLAEFIADDYFPNEAVNPELISRRNEISISYNSYGDGFDGMLEHKAGRFHIYVNVPPGEPHDSPRHRFTICHELGHYFIDEHRLALKSGNTPTHKSRCDFQSDNPIEIQADFFASNLLLPERRYRKRAGNLEGLESVLDASKHFRSSVTSSAIRYVTLDIKESLVVRWDSGGAILWKRLSPTVWRKGYRQTIASFDRLPENSATKKAIDHQPNAADFFSTTTTASFWFPFISQASSKNAILKEHSMRLGQYGGITLLSVFDDPLTKLSHS